jgi:small conductance mechanosensitive channel
MNGEVILSYLMQFLTTWGLKLLGAIIVLIVGAKGIKILVKFIKTSPTLDKLDDSLRSFFASFATIMLYVLLVITIAMILGVPATSFITILASCGVAIGLALQGSLSNFAGGLMILFFKPFKVGDYIEAAGEEGFVAEISVVYTVILTTDNKRITLPNGSLTNSAITNYSSEENRRVDLTFSADYENDVEKVKGVIMDVIQNHPLALKDPAPFVRLSSHADSALNYTARVWVKSADYWDVYFDLTESVKIAFDKNDISIPYPQLDVHVNER